MIDEENPTIKLGNVLIRSCNFIYRENNVYKPHFDAFEIFYPSYTILSRLFVGIQKYNTCISSFSRLTENHFTYYSHCFHQFSDDNCLLAPYCIPREEAVSIAKDDRSADQMRKEEERSYVMRPVFETRCHYRSLNTGI